MVAPRWGSTAAKVRRESEREARRFYCTSYPWAEAARGDGSAVAGVLGGYGGGGGTESSGRELGMAVEVVVMAERGVGGSI